MTRGLREPLAQEVGRLPDERMPVVAFHLTANGCLLADRTAVIFYRGSAPAAPRLGPRGRPERGLPFNEPLAPPERGLAWHVRVRYRG